MDVDYAEDGVGDVDEEDNVYGNSIGDGRRGGKQRRQRKLTSDKCAFYNCSLSSYGVLRDVFTRKVCVCIWMENESTAYSVDHFWSNPCILHVFVSSFKASSRENVLVVTYLWLRWVSVFMIEVDKFPNDEVRFCTCPNLIILSCLPVSRTRHVCVKTEILQLTLSILFRSFLGC